MASKFEINSDYSHDILDHIKSNLRTSSSSTTLRDKNFIETFSNSQTKSNDDLKLNAVSLKSTGANGCKNLYGLLMPKIKQIQNPSLPASASQSLSKFELNFDKVNKKLENTKYSSSRQNLKSFQGRTLDTPPSIWFLKKSSNTKFSLSNLDGKNIVIVDDVDILPLNRKTAFLISAEAIGFFGVIFAAVVLVCWVEKIVQHFTNRKSPSVRKLKIEKKSSQPKVKRAISVLKKGYILGRPIIVPKIMDTNMEDQLKDGLNNDSSKSTPYFTPLGTFDEGRSRFEYPTPQACCSGEDCGNQNSNEELLISADSNAECLQNAPSNVKTSNTTNVTNTIISTESPNRKVSIERRPCSPAWSYIAHLLTNNQVSYKSQYETYDNLYVAGTSPLFSAMSQAIALNSSRPSPPASASAIESNIVSPSNCRSPNVYDKEDKENEKPSKTIHKQQNSPLPIEVNRLSGTKFSFSPKEINEKSSSTTTDGREGVYSSPTISSAGYTKNGDYFKFPEVDLFSPEIINKINTYRCQNENEDELELDLSYPSNNLLQNDKLNETSSSAASHVQASRRARLKSISLDSEGAKLVEDNLGVPVQELIEITTPSELKANSPNKNMRKNISSLKNILISNSEQENKFDTDDSCCLDENSQDGHFIVNSNKTNDLSLKVLWYNDVNQNAHGEQHIIRTAPPKTPTLGKTKQKAISFDSSDSSKLLSSSPSSSMSGGFHDRDQNKANNEINTDSSPAKAISLMHISSLSMPGTPKRNFSPNKKCSHVANRINRTKQRQLNSNIHFAPSASSNSSFDHSTCTSKYIERQGFIMKLDSFNENCIDDANYGRVDLGSVDDGGENYFISFDDSASTAAASNTKKVHADYDASITSAKKLSLEYLIGSNLQTQKSATALSLSNSNLKTLPEVMTLSDFSVNHQGDGESLNTASRISVASSTGCVKQSNLLPNRTTARSSLLQRRGSNHSLTLNLNESYGTLAKGLSKSNYSLCSNPQYNLSNSIYNLTGSKQQSLLLKGNSIGIPTVLKNNGNNLITQGPEFGGNTGNTSEKKNLLQRRGSNTSLTLNIHGSSYVHLNRFKSHSSLNITSNPQQQNLFKVQEQRHHNLTTKDLVLNEHLSNSKSSINKKGLLERRGSNASLTINLQCNAVSNLRGSACSLSSINTNQLEEEYEMRGHQESEFLDTTAESSVSVGQQRKFFSSENLNNLNRSQYSKLNQTHMRNSTKTCFGSVSDLNNYSKFSNSLKQGNTLTKHIDQTNSESSIQTIPKSKQAVPDSFITSFEQSNLCSCTGLRNITTRPLSPQTTSEDFKMYLANIQLLQNASSVLDGYDLMKLNYVFEKSYNDDETHHETMTGNVASCKEQNQWKLILSSFFQFELPDENEQKRLIRSLHQEFWDLPTNHQEKPMVFGSQSKNRYKSILPNEHSRVQLIPEEGYIEDPYINANYIKGPDYMQKSYIATQGPLPNTIYDFWLMIFQNICKYDEKQKNVTSPKQNFKQRSEFETFLYQSLTADDFCSVSESTNEQNLKNERQKIIMLTNFVENNRQKCARYFPINENDIFLITFTNDEIENNDINIFYGEYFKKHETSSSNFDTFEIEINDKNIIDYLPKVNYFIIKNNGIIKKNGFSIRKLQCLFCCNKSYKSSSNSSNIGRESGNDSAIKVNDKQTQTVHSFSCLHYWYPDWPDHRSPSDISVLLEISQHMLTWDNSQDQPLPVIHCSAGIGRTGCMAAVLNAICQIRASFPLNSTNAIHPQDEKTSTKISPTKNAVTVACCSSSKNVQSSMSYVDNLQSFSSQSFSYSNISGNKIKNSYLNVSNFKERPIACIDKNRIQSMINVKNEICFSNSNSCSYKKQTKNNAYCDMMPTAGGILAAPTSSTPMIKWPSIHVDILGIVCNLRLQRGGMVQNSEQYELIYRAMCLYLKRVLKLIYEAQI